MKVDEHAREEGALGWEPQQQFSNGLYIRSVCGHCNNRCGKLYGGAYVDLVRRIAERIGDLQDFHTLSLQGVKRPLAILKQVIFQFVSANGQSFVRANDWVAPFLKDSRNQSIPSNVGVYLFASNCRGGKKTGVSSHIDLTGAVHCNIVAEFSFWPLGTIMSFGHLKHRGLAPIHQWVDHPFNSERKSDLDLPVNPIRSPYPLDFRSESQILRDSVAAAPVMKQPSQEELRRMIAETLKYSGTDDKDFVFSGHPGTARKLAD
jgi:hypothetical protein